MTRLVGIFAIGCFLFSGAIVRGGDVSVPAAPLPNGSNPLFADAGYEPDGGIDALFGDVGARGDRDLRYPIAYVLTYQLIGMAAFSQADKDQTDFESFSIRTFREGFKRGPEWDGDDWGWNYVAHPLWGSETFLRARSQNFNFFESFLFSTASSIVWEYGMENWMTHPSRDDLLITSTVGSFIGEIRYRVLKQIAGKQDKQSKVVRFVFDPLQSTTRAFGEKVLGVDWSEPALQVSPTATAGGSLGVAASVTVKF